MEQKTKKELLRCKVAARDLIVSKGITQKEVSKILGISERSLSIWVKKYKWKTDIDEAGNKYGALSVFITFFFEYIQWYHPDSISELKNMWNDYLKAYENNIKLNEGS